MAKDTLIALDGVGTFLPVLSTIFARRVKLQEDGAVAAGLQVKRPEDNFVAVFHYPPAQQPCVLGEGPATIGRGSGPLLGWPVQTGGNARAASVYALVASMGAATVLRVEEEE